MTGVVNVGEAINIGSGSTSFHVDSSGNMFLGATTIGSAPFKVTAAGALTATSVTVSGNISGTVDQSTEVTAPITLGTNGKLLTKAGTTHIELSTADANRILFKKNNATLGTIDDVGDGSTGGFTIQSGTQEALFLTSPGASGIVYRGNVQNFVSGSDNNTSGKIQFGGSSGNSGQILKTNDSNVFWGNASSAGVNAIQGTGNISTNNNTGSVVISNNHSHGNNMNPNNHDNSSHNVSYGTGNGNSNWGSSDTTNNATVQTGYNHANSGHVSNGTINLALQLHTPNDHDNNEHSESYALLSSYNNHLNNLHFSDQRLKNDVQETTFGLDFINKLRPVDFTWDNLYLDTYYDGDDFSELKSVISNQQQGFIAQEVKQAAFETNSSNTDFGGFVEVNITDEDQKIKDETGTTDDIHKLDYQQFVPPLVKAVQQLSAKIDVLEARIDELEGT